MIENKMSLFVLLSLILLSWYGMEGHGLGLGALGLIKEPNLLPFNDPLLGTLSINMNWTGLGLTWVDPAPIWIGLARFWVNK